MYVDYLVIKWASFEYSLESSCVWLLGVESRDFSQAEKERTAYSQNDNNFHSKWSEVVVNN